MFSQKTERTPLGGQLQNEYLLAINFARLNNRRAVEHFAPVLQEPKRVLKSELLEPRPKQFLERVKG